MRIRMYATGFILLAGCGSGGSSVKVPQGAAPRMAPSTEKSVSDSRPAPEAEISQPESRGVPTECSSGQVECLPDVQWVNSLCEEVYPEVALVLFGKETPWQRMYLRRKTDAINASGGATVPESMPAGEQLLILRHRNAAPGDIQMGSSNGQYDALRWNGSCVSLEGSEVTSRRPSRVKHARVEWKWLGDDMRQALRRSDSVTEAYRARRKECRGARSGSVTKKCQRLDEAFSAEIVRQVRAGISLPVPQQQP